MRRAVRMLALAVIALLGGGLQTYSHQGATDSGLRLRVAFMMGSRGNAALPPGGTAPDEARAFDSWDPTADNPELQNLLGLKQLAELSRATVTMPASQRSVSLTVVADRRHYELAVETAGKADEVVFLGLTVKEDGRQVSQPRVGLQLGQKGVVCARVARNDGEAFVFFVLQMDAL
jgi:hypothetical protein